MKALDIGEGDTVICPGNSFIASAWSIVAAGAKPIFCDVNEDMLMWTLPLYWGCPNINDIYPKNSYRYIDIEKPITLEDLTNPDKK